MNNKPIGVYDSGVGGVAVLKTMSKILPRERYILYADLKNSPYGQKSKEQILHYARESVEPLVKNGAKAVVVACNTATSAAIEELRGEYNFPIIGMEPALKPAACESKEGKILVFASPATLRFMKFQKLSECYSGKDTVPIECPGLSKLIEEAEPGSPEIIDYLERLLKNYKKQDIAAAVIGCTHYSYIEEEIKKATGCDRVYDGRYGTARHLKATLEEWDILGNAGYKLEILSESLSDEQLELVNCFLERPLSFEEC